MSEKKNKKPNNIYQRLHEAMSEVSYVQKTAGKNGMKYSFASHDSVTAAVRPALHKVGVIYYPQNMAWSQNGNRTEITLDVVFVNIDDPGDTLTVPSLGFGIDQQDKGPGKAISYAVKYALLKALGLETGDDPERDSEDHKPDARGTTRQAIAESKEKKAAETYQSMMEQIHGFKTPEDLIEWWEGKAAHVTALMKYKPQGSTTSMGEQLTASFTQKKADLMHAPAQAAE